MRNQVIYTILISILFASGFAQSVEIFGQAKFMHMQPGYSAAGWIAALTGKGAWKNASEALEGPLNRCASARSKLLEVVAWHRDRQPLHEIPIWQLPDSRAFFFVSGMMIDADGAPNAYSPDDSGLDELSNAGTPAHWDGIVTGLDGNPLIQQAGDPFPGYYISCTSLSDNTKEFTDQTGYVDASKIPYVVLPVEVADRGGARLGDFAFVVNLRNGKSSFAIYADIGNLGEGSVALANALGIRSDARHGGASDNIVYLLFPGSGNQKPRTVNEIQSEGEKLVYRWGGTKGISSCLESYTAADSGQP